MLDSKSRRVVVCCCPALAMLLLTGPAHGFAARETLQESSSTAPKVTSKLLDPNEDQDWTPLLFRKEHQPMPALRDVFEGIKRGGPENFEKAVRAAYRLVEAYGQNEGHKVTFQISDIKTLEVPEVLKLKLSDIASVGFPEQIMVHGVTREHVHDSGTKTSKTTRLGYGLKWQQAPPDPKHDFWTRCSFGEFVEIAKADTPALSRLRSVTTYRVAVTLDGIHREYRAAFLWMGGAAGPSIATFQGLDPVTQRMTLALTEQIPPEGTTEGALLDGSTETSAPFSKLASKYDFPVCNVYTKYPYTPTWEKYGSDRHVNSSYWHHAASYINVSCSCSSSCQSICNPSLGTNICQDAGYTTYGYHVAAIHEKMTSGTRDNALNLTDGATCQGTTLCAFTQCADANCMFTATISPTGVGFSTQPNQQTAFWAFEPTSSALCGGCTEWIKPVVEPDIPQENCPVLIALDEGRLEMTGLVGGVLFDLNRNGAAEHNSWPAAGSSWAFVVLDRNRNGRIDDGGELFGNYTMQFLDETQPNGYAALAAYDRPETGGNGDGVLDDRDAIFSSLLLWTDANHDGVSQPQELVSLAERVEEIGLEYREARSRDRYGNQFRYRGKVRLADGRISRSVDVFLLHD